MTANKTLSAIAIQITPLLSPTLTDSDANMEEYDRHGYRCLDINHTEKV